jgi:C-terminal processing protease CtpA/Prc
LNPNIAGHWLSCFTISTTHWSFHRDWILDVRGNPGGDDSTYYPLLSWLLTEREDVQAQWLSTPANIEGREKICAMFEPGDKECESYSASAVNRMRAVATGTYVNQDPGPAIRLLAVENVEPHRPLRVAVLIDRACGSSCEEFLLAVRQGVNVKLVGRATFGSLDYSNLLPHTLPSAERVLWYATSRSCRLPDLPVDLAGIQPDIYLPQPANEQQRKDEVMRVQSWLEGHSLAPTSVRAQ